MLVKTTNLLLSHTKMNRKTPKLNAFILDLNVFKLHL